VAHQVRDAKVDVDLTELQKRWRQEMGEEAYADLMDLVATARERQPLTEHPISASQALSLAVSHLTERTSVVIDHQVQAEALAAGRGRVDFDAIKTEMDNPAHGIIFGRPDAFNSRKLTTLELLEAEHRVLKFAQEGIGNQIPMLAQSERETRARDSILSDEQKKAVDELKAG